MQSVHCFGPDIMLPEGVKPDSSLFLKLHSKELFSSWDRCGLASDFVAAYFGRDGAKRVPPVENLISTVLNELVENAVKFSIQGDSIVAVSVKKIKSTLVIEVQNDVTRESADSFKIYLDEIRNSDIKEMYFERLEKISDEDINAGLGILMLMKDYSVSLSVRFTNCVSEPDCNTVTARVVMLIEDVDQ